jgi:hypothetical protein
MMMRIYLLIMVLAIPSSIVFADGAISAIQGSPSINGAWSMSAYGDVMGQKYTTDIRSSDLINTPAWSLKDENPPVSVREAARLAKKSLTENLGNLKGWSRSDITLKEWPGGH